MNSKRLVVFCSAALAVLLFAGCATPASRIRANPHAFARLSAPQQALVRHGQVALGFDFEAVKLALGDPDRIVTRNGNDGEVVVWHYRTYEAGGRILFTGYYHAGRRGWRWGPKYAYYLDFPDRRVRDRFRLEFREGVVSAVTEDRGR